MKVAFILSSGAISPSNGVVSQCFTWKQALEKNGHKVELIDVWKKHQWKEFDFIHFFGFSIYMRDFIRGIVKINKNIAVSPILDPSYSVLRLRLYSSWGSSKLNLTNPYHGMSEIKDDIKLFLARSEFEKKYLVKGFGIEEKRCAVVPLSYGADLQPISSQREPFCLHISLLADQRKNVRRLIQAAVKYDFKLILAGKIRNEDELGLLKSWIGNSENIEYKGFLSFDEMVQLYAQARVFALPSENEGVGIVGLEAAALGCDIVITGIGGPKEYYGGMAQTVDPYCVDEIGKAVTYFFSGQSYQPQLAEHIRAKYSMDSVAKDLVNAYSL